MKDAGFTFSHSLAKKKKKRQFSDHNNMFSVKICWREKMQMLMQEGKIIVAVASSFSLMLDKCHI